ncbi:hypothetical protein [Rhodophyticola porphyridii]|uniref:Lipoprotein n=1 Tax=Rhodophyticola porphyridii TaxID=1852017 RepID=A0A3L9Y9Y6_9RHOB|nr:hypothetical protein [Rhodophyticola porphyridii]RMA43947.1 hypothetical protein D9R08_03260 [Rhodophyticola porphyridii]
MTKGWPSMIGFDHRTYLATGLRRLFIVALCGGLAACVSTAPATPTAPTMQGLVSTPDAEPGNALATPGMAASLMQTVCSSADRNSTAAANGFVRNSRTGTLFHQRYNLSIRADGPCSLVFVSRSSQAEIAAALSSVPAVLGGARQSPFDRNETYYSALYGSAT